MTEFLAYNCKICSRGGLASYAGEFFGEFKTDVQNWKQMLVHDRCADFQVKRKKAINQAVSAVTWIHKVGMDNTGAMEKARQIVVQATRHHTQCVSVFHDKFVRWEPFNAEEILKAEPHQVYAIMMNQERVIAEGRRSF